MDLSTLHQPVSDLFADAHAEDPQGFRLSEEQVAFFHENGYLTGVRVLTDAQVEALREQLAPLMVSGHEGEELWHEYHSNESTNPDTVLFHALGAWRIQPGFHDALWNPRFAVPAAQLLGGRVRFWHDQLFCKPVRHGGVVAWHQDYSYWTRTKPMAHLTCWIGLDDATRDNGCLAYIPRSHEWELLPVTGLAGDMDAIQTVLSEEQKAAFHPVYAELRAGEAAFHHPLLVHGSYENRTDRPRRAMVINAMRDGVCSYTDEPLLQGVPRIRKGEKVDGQFFPLLGS
ncbi:MAG: phytanoyl-CoA dioxygenase family protein [Fimbriimonadaceae bacterium]|nr:phytanoyl-CoA dioxygenase family protein [Chthonomonadaceae bacterium]MCO5296958.1 phytanoyl-CoA dioxygenase family protein [Fimbriimonadaceae bacterium]